MNQLFKTLERLRRQIEQRLYERYYWFGFGSSFPFAGPLAARVAAWEHRRGRRDVPIPRDAWEHQYQSGHWVYLNRLDQLARYSLLVGYLHQLKPGSAVLDVGCGEGRLFQHYRPYGYARYVGLELSQTALANLVSAQDTQTTFLCVDAETYQPNETFDAIVFNETLYYFHKPLAVVGRYIQVLQPNGIILVSTYTGSTRSLAILRALKATYPLLDETRATHGAKAWVCSVFRPSSLLSKSGEANSTGS